jgi:hypothetical protein
MSEILKSYAHFAPANGFIFCCVSPSCLNVYVQKGSVYIGTERNTDATHEMKSIIGNAVNLSLAHVRCHPYVLPADTLIYSHVAKKGEGAGRAIGNAGCVCVYVEY